MKKAIFLSFGAVTLLFSSCKKDDSNENDATIIAERASLSESAVQNGISDFTNADATEVLNEAAVDKDFMGNNFTGGGAITGNILSCAVVTVTHDPGPTGFPKTILIDFGTGCTSTNTGITRSGKINVVVTDSLRRPGSVATMTFDNYKVQGFKKEGQIKWTNTGTATTKSWRRECTNGKITAPSGTYWMHSGTQEIAMVAGAATPLNLMDDEFTITGGHQVTNMNNVTRVWTITSPLHKRTVCRWVDKGTYSFTGPVVSGTLDFGNGNCDDQAVATVGGNTYPVTLP